MPEDSQLERQIAAVLRNSGLPMDRRAEIAEELRGHLENRIVHHRDAGLSGAQAVEAALADFGPAGVIRRQLRHQQWMLDRRRALVEIQRPTWACGLLVGLNALYVAAIAVLHPLPLSPLVRCLWGLVLLAGFLLLWLVPMYWTALLCCRMQRRRPREEYRVVRSFLRGMTWGGVLLTYALVWAPFWVVPVTPLVFDALDFTHFLPSAFWNAWWLAVLESGWRVLVPLAVGMVGFGLSVVLYERSRCVDESTVLPEA